MPALCRHIDAAESHRRLAAAHVALQEPVHAVGGFEIFVDFVHRLFLPLGELEREARRELRDLPCGARIAMHARVLLAPLDELER